jgi:hypothetical protein
MPVLLLLSIRSDPIRTGPVPPPPIDIAVQQYFE